MLDEIGPDEQQAMLAGLMVADPERFLGMLADAQDAAAMRDAGDLAGARAIVEQYREMCAEAGLLAVYEQLLSQLT